MIDDGLFNAFPKPDVVLGQHVMSLPSGNLDWRDGVVTSPPIVCKFECLDVARADRCRRPALILLSWPLQQEGGVAPSLATESCLFTNFQSSNEGAVAESPSYLTLRGFACCCCCPCCGLPFSFSCCSRCEKAGATVPRSKDRDPALIADFMHICLSF